MHRQLPPQFVLNFPLPLCSIFDTVIDNEIHNCFHISCCISHCHWVATTAISWQLHTSLHNSPEYFPPPSTTESTSCSIVPSPTSKHNEIHVWAFTIASTHHFASAMQSAHHPSSNQQTQPQQALTTASTAMTPPLTTCCSPSKHSTLHSSSSISHFTTAISTGSPSCLTSVKYTTPQINYPLPAWLP